LFYYKTNLRSKPGWEKSDKMNRSEKTNPADRNGFFWPDPDSGILHKVMDNGIRGGFDDY